MRDGYRGVDDHDARLEHAQGHCRHVARGASGELDAVFVVECTGQQLPVEPDVADQQDADCRPPPSPLPATLADAVTCRPIVFIRRGEDAALARSPPSGYAYENIWDWRT
jgi:hypothetical protein